jgi:predicted MPP superfamily phosphohydrolase
MLAGHTHGGQVAPFGHALILPPGCHGYVQGRYARPPHQLYVTRGLGSSHLPFRVGARPELAILDIHRTTD